MINPCGNNKCNGINSGIDQCIQPLVKAINDCGIVTIASCCGHGRTNGSIVFRDGREIIIAPNHETAREIERHFPDIHGNIRKKHNQERLNYLQFEDIKKLNVEELSLLKIELIENLASIKTKMFLEDDKDLIARLHPARFHYERVLGTVNGYLRHLNRIRNDGERKTKERLSAALARENELAALVRKLKNQNRLLSKEVKNKTKTLESKK